MTIVSRFLASTVASLSDVTKVKCLGVCFIVTLLGSDSAEAQLSWDWLNPRPAGYSMYAVDFLDSLTGIAVGDAGNALRSTDGGRSWLLLPTGFEATFNGVAYRSAKCVTAVGAGGLIISTTDEGASWSQQQSSIVTDLRAVSFGDADHGVVVGARGVVLYTTDGGALWSRAVFDQSRSFTDVQMINHLTAFAVIAKSDTMYRSMDGGRTWTDVSLGRMWNSTALQFVDLGLGFVASDRGLLRTTDGGSTWGPVIGPPNLRDIRFSDRLHGAGLVASLNSIVVTSDGGDTWRSSDAGFLSVMNTIGCANTTTFLAMGRAGRICRSTDAGASFTSVSGIHSNPVREQPDIYLRAVAAVDSQRFIAIGAWGVMLSTTDAGGSWTQMAHDPQWFNGIDFWNDSLGIVVGSSSTCLRTTDAGRVWSTSIIPQAYEIMAVSMADARHIYAAGLSGFHRSSDGGDTWEQIVFPGSPYLVDVDFCDSLHGLVGSKDGVLYRTTDGGATWSEDTLGQELEHVYVVCLTPGIAFASVNRAMYRVNGQGMCSRILENWYAMSFTDVCFSDLRHGAAVSGDGRVVHTSDGGMTWSVPEQISPWGWGGITPVPGGNFLAVGKYGSIMKTAQGGGTGLDNHAHCPVTPMLDSPYPHPSTHTISFPINLHLPGKITLQVYSLLGREIVTVLDEALPNGKYIARWDHVGIAAGIYLAVLKSEDKVEVRKILLQR